MTKQSVLKNVFLILMLPLLLEGCFPTRRLKEGEHLLVKNRIIDKDTKLDKTDIQAYIKQKPNRKIFKVIKFHLWLHNLVNEDRVKRRRKEHNNKLALRNEKRIAKGKRAKTSTRQLFGEWVLDVSEPPVIYDSTMAKRSGKQIKSFLNKKGYFISSVKDSVVYTIGKQAREFYLIKAKAPYTINSLTYKIPDELLKYYVFADSSNTLIKRGDNYDEDVFDKERERLTNELNNNGYYLFTKDYIYYQWDSSNHKVNLMLGIKNFASKYSETSDSIVVTPHKRFYINDIYIETDFVARQQAGKAKDTLSVDDFGKITTSLEAAYNLLHSDKQRYKTKMLLNTIFIHKGELYQLKNVEDSYKRLQEIKSFKTININFKTTGSDKLNCFIQLSPILKQSYTFETEGKNTSGNIGLGGSFVYQNRNLLKGAEVLEIRLKGSIEATKTIDNNSSLNNTRAFNTSEYGPEANIYIPRFLVPFKVKASKRSNPKTIFNSSYTYQHRPYLINNVPNFYTRYITNLSFGYTWQQTEQISHSISPFVISIVKVELPSGLSDYLGNLSNIYIRNSFTNHLSSSTRYTFTYNNQNIKKQTNFSFFRLNVESSGNIFRGVYELTNTIQPNTFEKDENERYKMFGVPYSQYLRTDVDYRFYYYPNELNKVIWRIAAGIGKPFINFTSLPFERSFFSGGANGIRAWQARTLGPGSYSNNGLANFDQFGDGQLELNLEYRFKMIKQLNGAIFVDAGNVWLRQPDASRPGGDFQFNRFYKELAVGSGLGIRADFSFFIIRFDLGVKIRDPQFEEAKRWVIQNYNNYDWRAKYSESHNNQKYGFLAFNIGIGYPF